ncbi:MAG: calcineurin [Deltaproteobacteria bacterium]|nr:calcineurin [Deltaproteobacteria bacterium]MCB9785268.1 calcineurin [Deltaproteobacteria bacterium]
MSDAAPTSAPGARRKPMVAWYDPAQLARTGLAAGVSALMGTRADQRLVEALAADQPLFDYAIAHDEVVIDFVADTGDGYAPTRAVAEAVRDTPVEWDPASRHRGRLVLLGGDQVYPAATRREYEDRFVLPWTDIFPKPEPGRVPPPVPRWGVVPAPEADAATTLPRLFAIPGNHDWYDGLASFSRLFTQRRTIGGLRTAQSRSYFALRLPGRWWLMALDIQLEGDIDGPQLAYFRHEVLARLEPGDRVIVCVAEPAWEKTRLGRGDRHLDDNLAFVEGLITARGAQVHVWLAGDLHYFRRWSTDAACAEPRRTGADAVHKITCGGGGAFLHPTHTIDPPQSRSTEGEPRLPTTLAGHPALLGEAAVHPPRATSRRLCAATLLFPLLNPSFGVIPALLYFATAAIAYPWSRANFPDPSFGAVALELAVGARSNPILWVWVILLLRMLVAFNDGAPSWRRALAGVLHGTAHLALAAVLTALTLTWMKAPPAPLPPLLAWVTIAVFGVVLAWVCGSLLLGVYLFIAVRFCGWHTNEAFSALHFQGYKSFLRVHVRASGEVRIDAFAVDDAAGTRPLGRLFRDGALAPSSSLARRVDSLVIPPPRPR